MTNDQLFYLCLEKKDTLYIAAFTYEFEEVEPNLLELKDVPTTHNLHGTVGLGSFAILK